MGRKLKPQEKHWVTMGERWEVEAQSGWGTIQEKKLFSESIGKEVREVWVR